ncbi:PDZ domain-containing protein [Corynebacterium yudongzhengii]|nr:PDZ domain-containing protein [Corynebacterium yudongzhengii]
MTKPPATETTPSALTRRTRTLALGAIPVVALGSLAVMDHVPFTDISLTVPYAAEGQGPMFDTLGEFDGTPVVEIDGTKSEDPDGELHMTTVSVRANMTLTQALGRWIFSNDTIVPLEQVVPPNQSPEEVEEANQAAFTMSEAAATVAAMNYLGYETEVVVADTIEGSPADGQIEANDIITAVDGEKVTEPSEVQDYVRGQAPGEEIELTVRRGEKEIPVPVVLGESEQEEGVAMVGILMSSQPVEDIDVTYNLQEVGGPSAGMIFSLAVIDKLSPGTLTGDNRVAGTGTIDEDGNVGPIGGIVHKVDAAEDEGIELFLAPSANCTEATSRDHGDMEIAAVDTLDDAINAMKAYDAGEEFPRCE